VLIVELRFDAMLYSNMGNENSEAGQIKCPRGPHLAPEPQVHHTWHTPSRRNFVANSKNYLSKKLVIRLHSNSTWICAPTSCEFTFQHMK